MGRHNLWAIAVAAAIVAVGLGAPVGPTSAAGEVPAGPVPPELAPEPSEAREDHERLRAVGTTTEGKSEPEVVPGQLVVRYKDAASRESQVVDAANAGAEVVDSSPSSTLALVETDPAQVDEAVAALEADPAVESVAPNFIRRASFIPNDANWADQAPELNLIRAPQAWDLTRSSSTVNVAVLDSGIDTDHPDLVGKIAQATSYVDGEGPEDTNGHGTAVAGIIAATGNNGIGITGVAPNVKLWSLKVLDSEGTTDDFTLAAALDDVHGADVVNLSLGGPGSSTVLEDAIADLAAAGVVIVAAAGNDGSPEPSFPAAYSDVVAVGATDATGDAAWFSNHGPWISVVAPGTDVASTMLGGGYGTFNGTSFAAPLVSGVAALRAHTVRRLSGYEQSWDLLRTAQDRGVPGFDTTYGFGIVDAFALLGAGQTPNVIPAVASGDADGTIDGATLIGAHATATISPPTDEDWFAISTSFGRMQLIVTPPTALEGRTRELDPVVEIYTPDHKLLKRFDAAGLGQPEIVGFDSGGGVWYARISNHLASASPGSYAVDVSFQGSPVGDGPPLIEDLAWVARTSPRTDAGAASRTANITVDSYQSLDFGTVNDQTVWLMEARSGQVVDGTVSLIGDSTISFDPRASLLPSTGYVLVVGGIEGALDDKMPLTLVGFVTQAGAMPSIIISGNFTPIPGDLTGDYATDIFWYGNGGASAEWLGGATGFSSLGSFGGWPSGMRPRLADVDGDNLDDVLVYTPGSTNGLDYIIRGGEGSAHIGPDKQILETLTPLVGDYDGNGHEDIFFYGAGTIKDAMWLGNASSYISKPVSVSGTYRPVVGDFNCDLRDDIFWHGPGTAADAMWLGGTNGTFSSVAYAVGGTYTVLAGDFNGNACDDILFYAPGTAADAFWHFTKTGRTSKTTSISGSYRVVPGDFDADGFDDLMFYAPGTATDAMWWGTPTGAKPL